MGVMLNGLRVPELDPNALQIRNLGELVADRARNILYFVVEDPSRPGVKMVTPVVGQGKIDLLEHLSRAHVIGNVTPTNYDKSTIWYNSALVYVEPENAANAYIAIQHEKTPGNWQWTSILPITHAKNVNLGQDSSGNTITLADIVYKNRIKVTPSIDVAQAANGELYVNGNNELYLKQGPRPEDQRLLGTVNTYLRERLVEQIKVSEEAPTNWNSNTIWLHPNDADLALARTMTLSAIDGSKSTGLKFTKENNITKAGATIENESKATKIDLTNTADWGHVLTQFAFNTDGKYYIELYVEDPQDKAYLVFLGNDISQPSSDSYGTEVDGSRAYIDSAKLKIRNVDTPKQFKMDKKTIFIQVDRQGTNSSIRLGYVLDDGTLSYIHGTDTNAGFSMNLARLAVGATSSNTSGFTSFYIRSILIRKIPDGYRVLNSSLPGEKVFANYAIATNAQSVQLGNNNFLSNFVDSGRLLSVLRDYSDRDNARVGELILDLNNKGLYSKDRSHNIFRIEGKYDDVIIDHIRNSMRVTDNPIDSLIKLESDPSRAYIKRGTLDWNSPKFIEGNMTVIDNSLTGDNTTYKIVLPKTKTTLVDHQWTSMGSGSENRGDLKTYLDELHNLVKNVVSEDNVYASYKELKFTNAEIGLRYNTSPTFFKEATKRMKDNAIYLETVGKVEPTTTENIDRIFNTPVNGVVVSYKDKSQNIHAKLYGTDGNEYSKLYSSPAFVDDGIWQKAIKEIQDVTTVNNLSVKKEGKFENDLKVIGKAISSKIVMGNTSGYIRTTSPDIVSESNIISYEGSTASQNTKISIGDANFYNLGIYSKGKPTWFDEDGTANPWITAYDLRNSWEYRGSLAQRGVVTDLSTIYDPKKSGWYYITSGNKASGYPINNSKGYIHTYAIDGNHAMQIAFMDENDSSRIYIRNRNNGNWSDWSITPNNLDMDLKFDKKGGEITGATTIKSTLKVQGASTLASVNTNVIKSHSGDRSIVGVSTDGTMSLGDTGLVNINVASKNVPKWTDGISTSQFALKRDTDAIANDLVTKYYSIQQITPLLNRKVETSTYTNDMNTKYDKAGGPIGGKVTINAGGLEVVNGSITFSNNTKFNIPGERFNTLQDFNQLSANSLKNILRYDIVNIDSNNDLGVFTISSNATLTTTVNTPSGIQISMAKDGTVSLNGIINGAIKTSSRTILFRDQINNTFTGTGSEVLSAAKGKELYSMVLGEDRGFIATAISGTGFNLNNFNNLDAGFYKLTSAQEKTVLGIDSNIAKGNEGILIADDKKGAEIRSFRYLTMSDNRSDTSPFVMGILTINNGQGEWKYFYDISMYYTKKEVDALLAALKAELLKLQKSSLYSFTGYSTNNSIPRKLVHTHNQETLGDEGLMYFKTNITCKSGVDSKRFNIYLDGYTEGELPGAINIILSGSINFNNATTTLEKINSINALAGSPVEVEELYLSTDGFVCFGLRNKLGNNFTSFDTYMRFSSITDTNFDGAITLYQASRI